MTSEQPEEQGGAEVLAVFDSCPGIVIRDEVLSRCGSTRRMMGSLGDEMKKNGELEEEMNVGIHELGGPIIDPRKIPQMLATSLRPAMYALRDVCLDCGEVYTIRIERRVVPVNVAIAQAGQQQRGVG